jgi:hypothetical protein
MKTQKQLEPSKELFIQEFGEELYKNTIDKILPEEQDPREWSYLKKCRELIILKFWIFTFKKLFAFGTKVSGQRLTHTLGIGGKGTLRIFDNFNDPGLPLFVAGKVFRIHSRQADATYYDNSANVVRSCSIKLLNDDGESELDLLMNSGKAAIFWNLPTFIDLMKIREKGESSENLKKYFKRNPVALEALKDNIFRIESLADLDYYSKIKYTFKSTAGKTMACQFRCISTARTDETKISQEIMTADGEWSRKRLKGDKRPYNHLHENYKKTLKTESIRYILQIAIKEVQNHHHSFSRDMFYLNADWVEPWVDLGEILIEDLLPAELTRSLTFAISNRPGYLTLPKSVSQLDYCSLAIVRDNLYKHIQPVRNNSYAKKQLKNQGVHYNFGTTTHPKKDGSNIKIKK